MSLSDLAVQKSASVNNMLYPAEKVEEMMKDDSGNIVARGFGKNTANLKTAIKDFDAASETLFAASDKMHAQSDALAARAKTSVARTKDMAQQMTDAMNRVTKMLGSDFEARLVQLERLADAMERLNELQEKGKLATVVAALSK